MIDLLLTATLILFIIFTCTWVIQLFTKNATIVDPVWALSVGVIAVFYFLQAPGEFNLVHAVGCGLGVAWALRLGIMLALRVAREKEEDKRYALIRREWQPNIEIKMLGFFWVQAIIDVVLTLPFLILILDERISFSMIHGIALLVCIGSLIGEFISDEQLRIFKEKKLGSVCNVGLWKYSRHPNYFFEWLYWVGIAMFVFPSFNGIWALTCPVMMYLVLVKMTGIPMLEEMAVKSRGEAYKKYQQTTNMFFPGPLKKGVS